MRARTIAQIAEIARAYAPELSSEAVSAFAYAVSGIGEQLGRRWLRNPRVPESRALTYYRTCVQGVAAAMLTDYQGPGAAH